MGNYECEVWALIPARGGSKSIPLKNLAILDGRPLIEYVIFAAKRSRCITRTICSTDHEGIASVCKKRGVEVHWRPSELSGDNVPVSDVLGHLLGDIKGREGGVADIVCVLQPTSPFVLPDDIDCAVKSLMKDSQADSVTTVTSFPHIFHAYNQRIIEHGLVRFKFPREREIYYNKQTKPKHYVFGNMVAVRSRTLTDRGQVFGERSLPQVVSRYYAADVDTLEDLEWAGWLLSTGRVRLPHVPRRGKRGYKLVR